MPDELINLSKYTKQHLENLAQVAGFIAGEKLERLTLNDFGFISRKEVDYNAGAQEQELYRMPSGKLLIAQLFGEHHYSENTMDSAKMYYYGYTPIPKEATP